VQLIVRNLRLRRQECRRTEFEGLEKLVIVLNADIGGEIRLIIHLEMTSREMFSFCSSGLNTIADATEVRAFRRWTE
jgi:hypothetical protein